MVPSCHIYMHRQRREYKKGQHRNSAINPSQFRRSASSNCCGCPAAIVQKIYQDKSTVYTVLDIHNHGITLSKVPISPGLRADIQMKLSLGVSIDTVMEQLDERFWSIQFVQNNISCHPRDAFISRKDVYNICYSLNLTNEKSSLRDKDDAKSAQLLYTQDKLDAAESSYAPSIRLFKTDVDPVPAGFLGVIPANEWAIVFCSYRMLELYRKYGHDNMIMVDSTHNTTGYKYELLTLMVMDEGGHGLPVAHYIIETESIAAYIVLFTWMKRLAPDTLPAQLMTDCNDSAFKAFIHVYGMAFVFHVSYKMF